MIQEKRYSWVVEAGSKSSKGTSKTTVIAIDGGSGGPVPHPVPVPWPVVHCHHHHHHLKYVPKPVMVHHWVKKFKYGPEELSATNIHDSKHLMPTMINEHEVPVVVPDANGPQPIEEVKMHVDGMDTTYGDDISSHKFKTEPSNYGEPTIQGNSSETLESGKPNHPFAGLNDQELDESRVSVNRNSAVNSVNNQLRMANEIEQTKAHKMLERLLKEQSLRLTNIHRENQMPLHVRGRHAMSLAEARSVELMSKLASQRANYKARKLISRMAERGRSSNKARQATSSGQSNSNNLDPTRSLATSFSTIRNLFGLSNSGSGRNRLSRASIKSPSKQWHVAFGDPMDFSASSVRGRVVAPPLPTSLGVLDIERHSLMNNLTKPTTPANVESGTHYSMPDLSSYAFSENLGFMPTYMSPPELFRRVPSTTGSGRNDNNKTTQISKWSDPETDNNLRRPDELVPEDPLSLIPSYLEFPVTPELWSEQALKSINAPTKSRQRFHPNVPTDSMNRFADPLASSSDWTSPSMADLNELFELSSQNIPKGLQASSSMSGVSSMQQLEAMPTGSMVNQQSPGSPPFESLQMPLTGGAPYSTSGTRYQDQFDVFSSSSKPSPSALDSSLAPLDISNSYSEPLMESSNELNQMRQFQSLLSQPSMANNLTGMIRLSDNIRNPMRTLGATQAAQLPSMPNIPSPPNIPMPGLPAPGMLLQMAGLALPFALARVQRQNNRQNQPLNTAASANMPRQRLLTRALNSVTRRRPRRPAQSSTTNSRPFRRLPVPQSTRLRSFMQTVRDMSQTSKSKPRTKIKPKMDAARSRKTRVGRAMDLLMAQQRNSLPLDAIPLVAQTDGSLRRFVPITSPLSELERELSRHQVAQQVDSFIPPQEALNRSPLYELHAVSPHYMAQADTSQPLGHFSASQPSNQQPLNSVTASNVHASAGFRSGRHHADRPTTKITPVLTTTTKPSSEDLSVVDTESQQFGQRQPQRSLKENKSTHRITQGSTRQFTERSTTESYSFPSASSSTPPPTTQASTLSIEPTIESTPSTGRPTLMKAASYVHAMRLVHGLAKAPMLSPNQYGTTPKVS